MNVTLLLRLLSAHLLADFFLQSDKLCKAKNESGKKGVIAQLAHAFIHALSAYILLADWKNWIIPLVIFVSHLIIDVLKSRLHGKGTVAFLCDQSVHILVIVLLWWWLYADSTQACVWLANVVSSKQLWAVILAYLSITKPASVLISKFIRNWTPSNNMQGQGMPRAGEWIGYIERVLILTFVITGNIEAVGFLLAAKSVFRFGDLNKAKEIKITEYVLLGTLASFTIALIFAFLLKSTSVPLRDC